MPAASCLRGSVGDVGECRQLICYERELVAACVRVAKLQAVEARHAHDKPPSQRSLACVESYLEQACLLFQDEYGNDVLI